MSNLRSKPAKTNEKTVKKDVKTVKKNVKTVKKDVKTATKNVKAAKKESYDCTNCEKTFDKETSLHRHLNLHDENRPFNCEECGLRFIRLHHLQDHKKGKNNHKTEKENEKTATKNEKTVKAAKLNEKTATKDVKKAKYDCTHCDKTFDKETSLQRHLNLHDEKRPFNCEECGLRFTLLHHLQDHKKGKNNHKTEKENEKTAKINENTVTKNVKTAKKNEKTAKINEKTATKNVKTATENVKAAKKAKYDCTHCDKTFDNETSFQRHLNLHDKKRPFNCEECGLRYMRLHHLQDHKRIHSKGKTAKKNEKTAEKNEKTAKKNVETGKYDCTHCDQSFDKETSLQRHLNFHEYEKTAIKNVKTAKINEKTATENVKTAKKAKYDCTHCDKTLDNETSFQRHLNRHDEKRPYNCDECGLRFTRLSHVKDHKMIHVTKGKSAKKPKKGDEKSFDKETTLQRHLNLHDKKRPVNGEESGQSYTRLFHVKDRKRVHVTKGKSAKKPKKDYGCSHCEKSFDKEAKLQRHMNLHDKKRPHNCEECGLRYTRLSHLQDHERIHTDEKPYGCSVCGLQFAVSSNLKSHKLLIHRIAMKQL